jgi:anti-anti-sigma factor
MGSYLDFRVTTMKLGRRAYSVTVAGELDLVTGTELEEELASLPEGVTRVLIDLGGVTFADATGLSLLARLATRLRGRGGGIVLVVGQELRTLIREAQLEGLFELRETSDDAARYLVGLSLLDSFSAAPVTPRRRAGAQSREPRMRDAISSSAASTST